jgi:acylphosphatase
MTLHTTISVTGKVQGVGYRYSARQFAQSIGLKGTVRNERDGSVTVEAEGSDEQIQLMIAWCHRGPARAMVDSVKHFPAPVEGFTSFDIR